VSCWRYRKRATNDRKAVCAASSSGASEAGKVNVTNIASLPSSGQCSIPAMNRWRSVTCFQIAHPGQVRQRLQRTVAVSPWCLHVTLIGFGQVQAIVFCSCSNTPLPAVAVFKEMLNRSSGIGRACHAHGRFSSPWSPPLRGGPASARPRGLASGGPYHASRCPQGPTALGWAALRVTAP